MGASGLSLVLPSRGQIRVAIRPWRIPRIRNRGTLDRTGVQRKMRQHALIGALIVMGAGAQAAPVPLGEDDLKSAVAGKTVSIDTPFGLPLTVNYGANGIMTGTAGTALAVYLGSAKDRGRWHIRNGKLCQKWFKWLSSEMTCLTLAQDGLKVYWRSDEGRTGTATIEPGPPVIEGATASGLGLPPQPAPHPRRPPAEEPPARKPSPPDPAPETRAQVHAAPPLPVPAPQRAVAHAAPPRREAVHPKPAVAMVTTRPVSIRASLVREPSLPPKFSEPAPSTPEPASEAARASAEPPEPTVARFAVAGLMALRLPAMPATPVAVAPLPTDPFSAGREPMRQAAEHMTQGVLEHRWCLGNAFAREPSRPLDMMADGRAREPELVHAPSLLAVAQERAYEGELPLYDAACLTEQPAIGMVARLIEPTE